MIDRDRNSLSIFDVLEDLAIKSGSRVAILPFHLLAVFRREDEAGDRKVDYDLTISNPSGKGKKASEPATKLCDGI